MLIFGYGSRAPKDKGAAAPLTCPNCQNLTWFHLVTQRTSVSVFFVPLVPVKTTDALVCQVCRFAVPLTRPLAAAAADMVRDTQRHHEGALTAVEYGLLVDRFWAQLGRIAPPGTPEGARWAPEQPATPPPAVVTPPPTPQRPPDPFSMPDQADTIGPGPTPASGSAPQVGVGAGGAEPGPPTATERLADPPAGWYADPYGTATERYWDGSRWTRAER